MFLLGEPFHCRHKLYTPVTESLSSCRILLYKWVSQLASDQNQDLMQLVGNLDLPNDVNNLVPQDWLTSSIQAKPGYTRAGPFHGRNSTRTIMTRGAMLKCELSSCRSSVQCRYVDLEFENAEGELAANKSTLKSEFEIDLQGDIYSTFESVALTRLWVCTHSQVWI